LLEFPTAAFLGFLPRLEIFGAVRVAIMLTRWQWLPTIPAYRLLLDIPHLTQLVSMFLKLRLQPLFHALIADVCLIHSRPLLHNADPGMLRCKKIHRLQVLLRMKGTGFREALAGDP
jgi:hypothetical protein